VRTTVNIREALLSGAKRLAAQRGVTLSDVVEDALRFHLANHARKNMSPFQAHVVTGEILDPLLNLDRTSELVAREDEEAFMRPIR
jgi:hypothetical protein